MGTDLPKLVTSAAEVQDIAREIRATGSFAMDLEFASEGRYVPELCLVQVAWQPESERGAKLALLDAQAIALEPIFELVSDADVGVVAHAARQDIALLATRFAVRAQRFWDTQIGAAFAGLGEQVGYGRLVGELLDIKVDKGPQFTDWTKRPLSERQLRYAAGDVTHLHKLWPLLRDRLAEMGRVDWVAEESASMVREVEVRVPPEEKFRSLGGWGGLRGKSAGAVVQLAAWREREALASNKPPSWILPDNALIELCRRLADSESALRRVKGVGSGTVRRYGDKIVSVIQEGAGSDAPHALRRGSSLSSDRQLLATLLSLLVSARCAGETLPPKLVGSKTDCESLVTWHSSAARSEPLPRMLSGWRRSFIGDDAVALLDGKASLSIAEHGIIVSR